MDEGAGRVRSTSTVIEDLAAHSREIGKFVDLISDVSRQTHMLAFNAAIEASRSGDAGRRLAVVAGEVKELSGKTARAAEDISRRAVAIQSSSGESSEAIEQLSAIVRQVDELTTVIAAAVGQQDSTQSHISENMASSEEITAAMGDIAGFSDHISEQAGSVQRAAQDLSALSGSMQQTVEQFKI